MAGILPIFQINEKVGFLYEKGGGTVRRIDSLENYFVEDESGFERPFKASELIKIHGTDYNVTNEGIDWRNEDNSFSSKGHIVLKESSTGVRKPIDIWELDLHIESLIDSHVGMSNAQILAFQLKELDRFYRKAYNKRIRKIILIHGVGEGVLKEEVRLFLSKKEGVEFYDADYSEYGKGATAAEIRYNL